MSIMSPKFDGHISIPHRIEPEVRFSGRLLLAFLIAHSIRKIQGFLDLPGLFVRLGPNDNGMVRPADKTASNVPRWNFSTNHLKAEERTMKKSITNKVAKTVGIDLAHLRSL